MFAAILQSARLVASQDILLGNVLRYAIWTVCVIIGRKAGIVPKVHDIHAASNSCGECVHVAKVDHANHSAMADPYYLETNVPGLFAAGDVRHGSIKPCASAAGEGAMAVAFVHRYLASG